MIAGRMRHRLTILMPTATTDRMGAEVVTYTSQGTIHAERVKQSGNRREEAGEHFPDYRAEFNIRDAHTISENWRVQVVGEHLYTVCAIVPNVERGFKTLICERVND